MTQSMKSLIAALVAIAFGMLERQGVALQFDQTGIVDAIFLICTVAATIAAAILPGFKGAASAVAPPAPTPLAPVPAPRALTTADVRAIVALAKEDTLREIQSAQEPKQ